MKPLVTMAVVPFVLLAVSAAITSSHGAEPQPKNGEGAVKKLFDSMRTGKYAGVDCPRLELADVPALLEHVDSTTMLKTFPTNPLSSQRQTQCSEGMVALWLIESVRQEGKYPSLNPLCFKDGIEKKDWDKASEDNHKDVAKAYKAWWKKAKTLSPEKARAIDPLKDTGLSWYGSPK